MILKDKQFQPFIQLGSPLLLEDEGILESPAVAAERIQMQGCGYAMVQQRQVVINEVPNGHRIVIRRSHDKSRGSIGRDLFLIAVQIHQIIGRVFAQQVLSGALVRIGRMYRNYQAAHLPAELHLSTKPVTGMV